MLLKFLVHICMMADMDNNIFGLIASFLFLGSVIVFALVVKKVSNISSETMRKIVHIGVSNWWFFEIYFFTSLWYTLIGPLAFILVNTLFTFLDWGKAIGLDDRKRNYGLIYFPITLLILVILQYQGLVSSVACTIGVLVMGYGDGFAAIVGKKWGKKKLSFPTGGKTYLGTLVMFIVSFLVSSIALVAYTSLPFGSILGASLLVGLVASIAEAITPLGLDNLSVPLLAAWLVEVLV